MIDFRYHLVSIVAVFLALAIGIVLGSTELQGPTYNLLNQTTATRPSSRPTSARTMPRRSNPWCCTTCWSGSGC